MSDSSKEVKEINMSCTNNTCIHYDEGSEDNCIIYKNDAFLYCDYGYKRDKK